MPCALHCSYGGNFPEVKLETPQKWINGDIDLLLNKDPRLLFKDKIFLYLQYHTTNSRGSALATSAQITLFYCEFT